MKVSTNCADRRNHDAPRPRARRSAAPARGSPTDAASGAPCIAPPRRPLVPPAHSPQAQGVSARARAAPGDGARRTRESRAHALRPRVESARAASAHGAQATLPPVGARRARVHESAPSPRTQTRQPAARQQARPPARWAAPAARVSGWATLGTQQLAPVAAQAQARGPCCTPRRSTGSQPHGRGGRVTCCEREGRASHAQHAGVASSLRRYSLEVNFTLAPELCSADRQAARARSPGAVNEARGATRAPDRRTRQCEALRCRTLARLPERAACVRGTRRCSELAAAAVRCRARKR